ncbi:PKD domain-containing protein [Metasolibacillus meyeri]|uniref:PKD domain-containing protein n=1 Tax=Metasolibacillus meyeri TaxID=1071052 RepID=A0AAW9NPR7_9BACL|nr:PKD domain-containing protein [Metasolibacillus meyeri]MEC1177264.1 PKD domain-containing protein [Metasolibacillus meyeri]
MTPKTQAANEVPFYDGENRLSIIGLIPNENDYRRVDSKGLSSVQYLGDFRYATIYDGKLSGSPSSDNTTFNVNGKSVRAYAGDKWYHIVPDSLGTARNLVRIKDLTENEFINRYGGSAEGYKRLTKYEVTDYNFGNYGKFYYIGNVVKQSGGFAENTSASFDSTNPTRLRILRTAHPNISSFTVSATNTDVGKPVTFDFTAFEYNYGGNKLDYTLIITDADGKEVGRKVQSVASTKNASGGLASQDRAHTGKYEQKNFFSFTPATEGRFTATLTVTDGVYRSSTALTRTFNAKQKGQAYLEVTPPSITIPVDHKATYQAFYTDTTGKRTEVTDKATWRAVKTDIAATSGKGLFTSLKEGETQVEASYQGAKDQAELIVSSTPPEEEEEPEPDEPNIPPTVELIVPAEVTVGQKFCAVANAHDEDGEIVAYGWDYTGRGDPTGRQTCGLYYEAEGEKTVTVVVRDDDGDTAMDTKQILVTKPTPNAHFTASGTFKENRKISIEAAHPYVGENDAALKAYPLVKETWTIATVDSAKQDKLKIVQDISGNVPHTQVVDMLFKTTGEIRITRYVENSVGDNATYTITINVIPDLEPVADFEIASTIFREPNGQTAQATIEIQDKSYSTDDIIQKRIWRVAFDSNNDGNFSDENFVVFDENNTELAKYLTSKVGKYQIELEVFEKYIHETIPQFVDLTFNKATTDLRHANTDSKAVMTKIVEVDNLAPVATVGLKDNKETVEVQYDLVDSPYSESQLKSMTPYLNNLLEKHDLKANVTFATNKTHEHQVFADGEDKSYILTSEGKVYGMGGGIIGNGSSTGVLDASGNMIAPYVEIPLPGRVKQITAYNRFATHFLLENGDVYGVGANKMQINSKLDRNGKYLDGFGHIDVSAVGDGTMIPRYSPVKINFPDKVVQMDSMLNVTLFLLENGEVYAVGNVAEDHASNVYNPLIIFNKDELKMPADVPRNLKIPVKVKDLAIGKPKDSTFTLYYVIIIDENDTAYGLGDGRIWRSKQEGSYAKWERLPEIIQGLKKATKITNYTSSYGGSTDYFNLFIKKDGSLIRALRTGLYSNDEFGYTFNIPEKIKDFASTYDGQGSLFLTEANELYAAGSNRNGELGFPIGTRFPYYGNEWATDYIYAPMKVPLAFKVQQVSMGSNFTRVLAENGNLYVVGRNENANLGIATKEDVPQFTRIGNFNIQFRKSAEFKQQPSPMYMTTFGTKALTVEDIQEKMKNSRGYYVGITTEGNRASVNTVVQSNNRKGTFLNIGTAHNDANLRAKIEELANYIIGTQNNNAVEIEFLLDTSTGISPATLESKVNAIVKTKVEDNSSAPFEARVQMLTNGYQFNDVQLGAKNKFIVAVKNNAYTADMEKHLIATSLVNNAHFLGMGAVANKGTIDRIITMSMHKGAYINNANIDAALNEIATYILNELERSRGITELFITTEEQIDYEAHYSDYEKDDLFQDYWKFNHQLSFFESERGVITDNNQQRQNPYRHFGLTGRYQVFYAAQDDPLTRYFALNTFEPFIDYRKWSNEADNLKIYVHKMPSAEFTFTIDEATGQLDVTSVAHDEDKASIDVGFGQGLQSQRFDYRIEEGEWIDGVPSHLVVDVQVDVRNRVIDFQGKAAEVIKTLSLDNLPPVAKFETDKPLYEVGDYVVLKNTSYDPNNDDLVAEWSYKLQEESAYTSLETGKFTSGTAEKGWHTAIPYIACNKPSNESCFYDIQLKVTDTHGLFDETVQTVEVQNIEKVIAPAEGSVYWELQRLKQDEDSYVVMNVDFEVPEGKHYATRAPLHVLSCGSTNISQIQPINIQVAGASVKGQTMSYQFSYEYAEEPIGWKTASCIDGICEWEFDYAPDWSKVQVSELAGTLAIDHSMKDTVQAETFSEILTKQWIVGRQAEWDVVAEELVRSDVYYESYQQATTSVYEDHIQLKTQTMMPMTPGTLRYQVTLPSVAHQAEAFYPLKNTQSHGTYVAAELDDSLQPEFADGIQLQQLKLDDKGMNGANRVFEANYVSDLFFITKSLGFMSGYRYAEQVQQAIVNDQPLPAYDEVMKTGIAKGEADFTRYTENKVPLKDEWMYTEDEATFASLQRYAIPVNPYSELHPNAVYENEFELVDMGLNDLHFAFKQTFSFEHYLFGSGYDDAWIIGQQGSLSGSLFKQEDIAGTIVLTQDQIMELGKLYYERMNEPYNKIHNFRYMDRTYPDKAQKILND